MKLIFKPLLFVILSTTLASIPVEQFKSYYAKITPAMLARMKYTWRYDAPVALEDLRYLHVKHYDFNGKIKAGELKVNFFAPKRVLPI